MNFVHIVLELGLKKRNYVKYVENLMKLNFFIYVKIFKHKVKKYQLYLYK